MTPWVDSPFFAQNAATGAASTQGLFLLFLFSFTFWPQRFSRLDNFFFFLQSIRVLDTNLESRKSYYNPAFENVLQVSMSSFNLLSLVVNNKRQAKVKIKLTRTKTTPISRKIKVDILPRARLSPITCRDLQNDRNQAVIRAD